MICRSTTSPVRATAATAMTRSSRSTPLLQVLAISRPSTAATARYGNGLNGRRDVSTTPRRGPCGALRCRSPAHAARKNTMGMETWVISNHGREASRS